MTGLLLVVGIVVERTQFKLHIAVKKATEVGEVGLTKGVVVCNFFKMVKRDFVVGDVAKQVFRKFIASLEGVGPVEVNPRIERAWFPYCNVVPIPSLKWFTGPQNFIIHANGKVKSWCFADIRERDVGANESVNLYYRRERSFSYPWAFIDSHSLYLGLQLPIVEEGYNGEQSNGANFYHNVEYFALIFSSVIGIALLWWSVGWGDGLYDWPNSLALPILAFISGVILVGVGIGTLIIKAAHF